MSILQLSTKLRRTLLFIAVLGITTIAASWQAKAQTDTSKSSSGSGSNFFKDNVQFSGELGAYGELYSINGQESRRPSSTGRLFFRPTVSLFHALSLNFDFLLSTEGASASQNINQFALNPTWSWGRAHLGDFSEQFSEYSLNGILVRGGGFTINPGIFRLSAIGGYTRRTLTYGTSSNGFDRYLYGGKLGVGTDAGSYVDLLFLRVRDDVNSSAFQTQAAIIDSANPSATPLQASQTKPQENLIAGLVTNIRIFDNLINWKTEATGSLFTRDMTVHSDSVLKLPDAVTKIYNPNITSNADAAIVSNFNFNLAGASLQAGYKYIGTGYTSLGVGSLLNDVQELSLAPSFRIATWNVALSYARQNDNLIKQKLNTTTRNTYAGTVSFQPASMWFATLMGNRQSMANDATNDTNKIGFSSLMLGTNQMLMFAPGSMVQNVTLTYIYQHSGDDSPLRASSTSTIHSINVASSLVVTQNITLSPSVGIVSSKVSTLDAIVTQTYGVAAQHRALENKLITTLSEGVSLVSGTKSFRTGLSSMYQWTGSLNVGLTFSMMNFRGGNQSSVNFNEFTTALNITERF